MRFGSALNALHHAAFFYGFREVYGLNVGEEAFAAHIYNGRTDMFIARDILRKRGVDKVKISEGMNEMFDSMSQNFSKNIAKGDYKDCIIDGVAQTLEQLSNNKELILGLLTGNARGIARMKMEALHILDYFKIGGYGSSSEKRAELVGMAIADAVNQKLFNKISMKQVYVIGDTKYDIDCAKEAGAVSIAVATGISSKADLEIYKPDYLLSKLTELIQVVNGK